MIHLRALELDDLDILYTIENDEEHWAEGLTTVPYSREALRTYILTCSNDFFLEGQLRLAIVSEGEMVGCIDLCNYDARAQRAEVSIALLPAARGRGIGVEAVRALQRYTQRHLHLHQLYAMVSEANHASQAVFARCGFEQTAQLRDWIRGTDGTYHHVRVFQYTCV